MIDYSSNVSRNTRPIMTEQYRWLDLKSKSTSTCFALVVIKLTSQSLLTSGDPGSNPDSKNFNGALSYSLYNFDYESCKR